MNILESTSSKLYVIKINQTFEGMNLSPIVSLSLVFDNNNNKVLFYILNERESDVPEHERHSLLSWLEVIADVSLNCSVLLEKGWKFDGNAGNDLSAICVKVCSALAGLSYA